MTNELTKLRIALAESQTRERIAVQELQKMRQRAQDAEKALHWNNIEVDKDGFATNKAYVEITANLPILIKDIVFERMFLIDIYNIGDWAGDLQLHPEQYKWRKIHE